jgi:hypothetical protein
MPEDVTILVSPALLDRFDEVVQEVQKAGLHVETALRTTGVIAGSIEPDRLELLRNIRGVAAVDTQRAIHLPPPDSPIQ